MNLDNKYKNKLMQRLDYMYGDAKCNLNYHNSYQLLVATILSTQSTDKKVNIITPILFNRFPDPISLANSDVYTLENIIKPIGLFRNKARSLKNMASILIDEFSNIVPSTMEQLTRLPGVGIKVANVIMANAFNIPTFAVDTHVYRIAKRLNISSEKKIQKVENDLCNFFPKKKWTKLHHQLVEHGRKICCARQPNCNICHLNDICPTGLGYIPDPYTNQYIIFTKNSLK